MTYFYATSEKFRTHEALHHSRDCTSLFVNESKKAGENETGCNNHTENA